MIRSIKFKTIITISLLCLFYNSSAYAETSLSFAPAPVAKALLPGETTNRISTNYVNLAIGESEKIEYNVYGATYTQRIRSASNPKNGKRFSFNAFTGGSSAVTDGGFESDMTGLGYLVDRERYGNRSGSLVYFGGMGIDILDIGTEMCLPECQDISMINLAYSLRLGMQNRFAINHNFGITPYVLGVYTHTDFWSNDIDIVSEGFQTTSTTFGLDIDFRGVSLAAFHKNSGDVAITSLAFGFNF